MHTYCTRNPAIPCGARHCRSLAVKRSAVRSRLSPLKRKRRLWPSFSFCRGCCESTEASIPIIKRLSVMTKNTPYGIAAGRVVYGCEILAGWIRLCSADVLCFIHGGFFVGLGVFQDLFSFVHGFCVHIHPAHIGGVSKRCYEKMVMYPSGSS